MNSKERVQAAIARQPVDRVPLGFYAVDCDTVERVIGHKTYVRDKIAIQIALWEGRRDEVAESLKRDTVKFYRKIDCADLIVPKEAALLPPKDYDPNPPRRVADDLWEDREGRVYKAAWDTNEIACIHDPTLGRHTYTVEEFEGLPDVPPPDPSVFEAIDHVIDAFGDERYVASLTGITAMTLLDGMERGLMLYALHPEVIEAANRRSVAVQNAHDAHYIRKGSPGAFIEQDIAGTGGPLISPRMFRRLCFPYFQERVRHIKQFVPQVIFHNCGNNIPLMPMFVESGIDCYQSLQTTAGMEVGRLKALFGDHLAFWGGIPVEDLITGTSEDVRRDVRGAMERGAVARGAPGSGFILGPSHSIAFGTKYDNFMAMLDEFVALRDKF